MEPGSQACAKGAAVETPASRGSSYCPFPQALAHPTPMPTLLGQGPLLSFHLIRLVKVLFPPSFPIRHGWRGRFTPRGSGYDTQTWTSR